MICSLYEVGGEYVQTYTKNLDDGEVYFKIFTTNEPRYNNPTYECNALWDQPGHSPTCGRHLRATRINEVEFDYLLEKQGEALSARSNGRKLK